MNNSFSKFILFLVVLMLTACLYGDDTLKVVSPEFVSLIEEPEGAEARRILNSHEDEWFFILQVIVRQDQETIWLGIRVYTRSSALTINQDDVVTSVNGFESLGKNYTGEQDERWYSAFGNWSYRVIRLKTYSYPEVISLGVDEVEARFSVTASLNSMDERKSQNFKLELRKVRYSGW